MDAAQRDGAAGVSCRTPNQFDDLLVIASPTLTTAGISHGWTRIPTDENILKQETRKTGIDSEFLATLGCLLPSFSTAYLCLIRVIRGL